MCIFNITINAIGFDDRTHTLPGSEYSTYPFLKNICKKLFPPFRNSILKNTTTHDILNERIVSNQYGGILLCTKCSM